jgi:hypothetical protein
MGSRKTRRGQFLGFSSTHARTVGLIRNLRTGSITPQFHCVHDSEFQTTHASDGTPPSDWRESVVNHRYATLLDEDTNFQLTEEWLTPDEVAHRADRQSWHAQPRSESTHEKTLRSKPPTTDPTTPVVDLALPRKAELPSELSPEPDIKIEVPSSPSAQAPDKQREPNQRRGGSASQREPGAPLQ